MNIGKEVKKIMVEKQIKQMWLAKKIGVTEQTISSNLQGKRDLRMSTVNKMLDVLGYELKIVKKED